MTNMIGYSNIHAYMQGKYIQSMFTETKVETDTTAESKFASFGMSKAEHVATKQLAESGACDALEAAAEGVPICGIVKFLAWCFEHLWDLSQNTPSSQSGYL